MNQETNERIGRLMVRIREHLGFDQTAFAETLGISQGNLWNIEAGKRRLTVDVLQTLADVHKVNINCFFYEDDQQLFISKEKDQIKQILNTLTNIGKEIDRVRLK